MSVTVEGVIKKHRKSIAKGGENKSTTASNPNKNKIIIGLLAIGLLGGGAWCLKNKLSKPQQIMGGYDNAVPTPHI